MAKGLVVILEGRVIGEVHRTRSGVLRLDYHREATRPGTTPLSRSLLPERRRHRGDQVENFLFGLLPASGDARRAIARKHQADAADPLSLLGAIGKDCAGAVQFAREDEVDAVLNRSGHLELLSDAAIEARLSMMDVDAEASWVMHEESWSLGGVQDKFTLRLEEGRWHSAHGAEPTTHIVKPGIRKLKGQALAEHVSMTAARQIDLDAAVTEYDDFLSERAIVVKRYDRRRADDGRLVRLHQEDLTQSLGREERRELEGESLALKIVTHLRRHAESPHQARENVRRFTDALIYQHAIGAPDAHASNYSILLRGESVELAPMYDVATGLQYDRTHPDLSTLAMGIGGETRIDRVNAEHWKRFAGQAGLDERQTLERVEEIAGRAPGAFARALEEVDDWDGQVSELRKRLMPRLEEHASRVEASATAE